MIPRVRIHSGQKRSTNPLQNIDYSAIRRFVVVKEFRDSSESPSDSGSEKEEETASFEKNEVIKNASIQFDYWTILKVMKFLKFGDQMSCINALACLQSMNLSSSYSMYAVTRNGGLETLVNIVSTNDINCRIGALQLLEELCKNRAVATKIIHLGICPLLIKRLCECSREVVEVAAALVSKVAFRRKAARSLRMNGGIELLVSHINVTKEMLLADESSLSDEERMDIRVAANTCHALRVLSRYTKNKMKLMKTGIVNVMAMIILSGKKELIVPMTGVLCECSTEKLFQVAVETEGLVGVLIKCMLSTDTELQCMSALALSRAAGGNEMVRKMIHFHHGPKVIVQFIKDIDRNNKPLVIAGISALWKSAISTENVTEFEKQDAVSMLSDFLAETHLDVLCVTVGAIAEMAKSKTARVDFINRGCMTAVINMLGHINEDLLVNAAYAVGVFANCDEGMEVMDKCDGLRLLWSLLMNSSRRVKVQALWAVKPYVARHPDSGEIIRSLMGSLTLLVKMLQQKDREVLAAVCAVISEVALDLENLAVMTEQGVVKRLATLITKEKRDSAIHKAEIEELRNIGGIRFEETNKRIVLFRELSSAIANCASLEDNRRAFGRAGIIPVLVGYLETKNSLLLAQACRALNALSKDNFNCVSIQSCGALPCLLTAIESRCMVTQVESTSTVRNIRNMLIRGEVKKIAFECLPRIESDKKRAEIEAIVKVLSGHRRPEDEKEALLKGTARPSTVTPSLSIKNIKRNKSAKIIWADTIKKKFAQKPEPIMSWRERMNLFSRTLKETKSSEKRPFETEIILKSKVATQKGRPVGSQTSSSHLHEEAVSELKAGTGI